MAQTEREHTEVLVVAGHSLPLVDVRVALRTWWIEQGRDFPWRSTNNPFHILLAEMMLRRTRARQVRPVYNRFIECYPDPQALADAAPEEVAATLYSLGLSWRVPAFQQLARSLVEQYAGAVPPDYEALIELPGVGDYVAAAICCFAFDQPRIIADTNTVRVAGRLVGVPTHAESRRRKAMRDLLEALLDHSHPRAFNYALLDLAALICTPSDPHCPACPLVAFCKTGQERLHV